MMMEEAANDEGSWRVAYHVSAGLPHLQTNTHSRPAERHTLESHVRSTEGADETLLKLVSYECLKIRACRTTKYDN